MEQLWSALAAVAVALQAWAVAVRATAGALSAVLSASFQLVHIAVLAPLHLLAQVVYWVAPSWLLGGLPRRRLAASGDLESEPSGSFREAEMPFYRLPSAPAPPTQPALELEDDAIETEPLLPKGLASSVVSTSGETMLLTVPSSDALAAPEPPPAPVRPTHARGSSYEDNAAGVDELLGTSPAAVAQTYNTPSPAVLHSASPAALAAMDAGFAASPPVVSGFAPATAGSSWAASSSALEGSAAAPIAAARDGASAARNGQRKDRNLPTGAMALADNSFTHLDEHAAPATPGADRRNAGSALSHHVEGWPLRGAKGPAERAGSEFGRELAAAAADVKAA